MLLPDLSAWHPYNPEQLAGYLQNIDLHWYVVGGWALDLYQNKQTRDHEDLEICIFRHDLQMFQTQLKDLEFFTAYNGCLSLYDAKDEISSTAMQFWGLDVSSQKWRIDIMIDKGSQKEWVYKRSNQIKANRSDVILSNQRGISYLAPQVVLLFKAKHMRIKDVEDFEIMVPHLNIDAKKWLIRALEIAHPDHSWIEILKS